MNIEEKLKKITELSNKRESLTRFVAVLKEKPKSLRAITYDGGYITTPFSYYINNGDCEAISSLLRSYYEMELEKIQMDLNTLLS